MDCQRSERCTRQVSATPSSVNPAPPSPYNTAIGPHRRFTWARVALADVKAIKDSKLKVQGSIQGDSVRVSGKSRDDLQSAMQLARGKQDELAVDLMFENFRD